MTHKLDHEYHARVRAYYGRVLRTSRDLKTNACCSLEALPVHQREVLAELHPDIVERFYGCGSPIPLGLNGATVLDLGCGTGRDAYVVSKLVGPRGRVIGIDMTDEQLAIARKHVEYQTERFGFREPNIDFKKGIIEDLSSAAVAEASVDCVISNCVLNLSPDKPRALAEAFRVLKPGGELYFSDIYSRRRVPQSMIDDPMLYGECLAGAMYIEDFRRLMASLGCLDFRITSSRPIEIEDPELRAKCGQVEFESITIRAFKLSSLEDRCEDYGQLATYRGNLPESPHRFVLDRDHDFEAHRPRAVCGNTAAMLGETRYQRYFDVIGNRERHFGLFDCAQAAASEGARATCC